VLSQPTHPKTPQQLTCWRSALSHTHRWLVCEKRPMSSAQSRLACRRASFSSNSSPSARRSLAATGVSIARDSRMCICV
jgi:hypothetical protein